MGKVLVLYNDIDGLFFIGSLCIGRILYEQFVGYLGKILVFEMGGNNLLIVKDVVDVDVVVYDIVQFVFIMLGQCCMCVCCLFLLVDVKGDEIFVCFIEVIKNIKVGDYDVEEQLFMGVMILSSVVVFMVKVQ